MDSIIAKIKEGWPVYVFLGGVIWSYATLTGEVGDIKKDMSIIPYLQAEQIKTNDRLIRMELNMEAMNKFVEDFNERFEISFN